MFENHTRQPNGDNLCLFRAQKSTTGGTPIQYFKIFIKKLDGFSPNQFQVVNMNNIQVFEDLLTLDILLHDIDIKNGNIIGQLARRSVQEYENKWQLLRYDNHLCFGSNINAVFQSFCCPNCDILFKGTFNLDRNLTRCSERVTNVYPRNVCQIPETLFVKFVRLDSFRMKYTRQQEHFENLAKLDFKSICLHEETFKGTKTKMYQP